MKRIAFTTIILLLIYSQSFSQRRADIGVYGGGAFYMGDVNQQKLFYSMQPAYGGFYRYNFSSRYSLRFATTVTELTGNDQDFDNPYQQWRDHSFESNLTDISALLEFNFFPYVVSSDKYRISPFVATGATMFISPAPQDKAGVNFAIPINIGFKFNISERVSAGAEIAFRRAFSDYVDQLDNFKEPSSPVMAKQRAFTSSDDWYSFSAVFLTYKIINSTGKCWAYGRPD